MCARLPNQPSQRTDIHRPPLIARPPGRRPDGEQGGSDARSVLAYEVDGGGAVQTKQQILKAIDDLPDDAGVEDALDRLYLLYKVERGLRQADRGELISQQEVRQRMAKWLE